MTHAKGATTAAIPECNKDGAMMSDTLSRDNMVSYIILANLHTGATLLLHSCTLSSSVEPARNCVICEYHHASCPCVNIVYLQSRSFALALLSEFKMSTRTFFTEII